LGAPTDRGSKGILEVGIWDHNPRVQLNMAGSELGLDGTITSSGIADRRFRDVFCRQLDDFADAMRNRREPFIPRNTMMQSRLAFHRREAYK
jgi:hypothetical protein